MTAADNTDEFDYKGYAFLLIAIIIMAVLMIVSYLIWPFRQKSTDQSALNGGTFSDVRAICELATVRNYYHNVAEFEKQPDGLYKYGYGKFGYKKMWLEYSGSVELGINVDKVIINEPDNSGIVKVYLPDAEILNVYFDKESMRVPVTETGVLTKITAEDEATAFAEAQENMKQQTALDEQLFAQAESRARQLIKSYVENTGKQLGISYKVEWMKNAPEIKNTGEE